MHQTMLLESLFLPRAACTRFFHSLGLILENFSHSFRIHAAHAATELHSFGVDALSLRGIGKSRDRFSPRVQLGEAQPIYVFPQHMPACLDSLFSGS